MNRLHIIENMVTISITAISVVGLFGMGAGYWSFMMLLLLLNINYNKVVL